jgi:hypothetical protein
MKIASAEAVGSRQKIAESGMIPTAALSFDSPLSPDDLLLPTPYGMERNEMLNFFESEADFIGFIQFQYIGKTTRANLVIETLSLEPQ